MTNDNRNNYFLYSDSERKEVKPFESALSKPYDREDDVEFFSVGTWQFDLREDADLVLAREAALAWIAWVEFLEERNATVPQTTPEEG